MAKVSASKLIQGDKMRKVLRSGLSAALVLGLLLSGISCTQTSSVTPTPAPTPTPTPAVTPILQGETIVVTSTADSGPGTLRQALLDAQSGDTITFDPAVFPPSAPATIYPSSQLPPITQGNMMIDASNAGMILDGRKITTPQSVDGLSLSSNSNTIRGLQIVGFSDAGIALHSGASYNVIGGDWGIGAGPLGQGNLISGNGNFGIGLWDEGTSHNTIQGNYIGITLDGMATWGHSRDGIHSNGANHNLITGNVIGGNNNAGVMLCCVADGGNVVTGNIIGTDEGGANPLGNHLAGVLIDRTSYNVIGPGNIIAYNTGQGIMFWENTAYNTVTQNSIHDNGDKGINLASASDARLSAPLILEFDLQVGSLAGWACANCTVEVFSDSSDEGAIYEGQTKADSNGEFNFSKGVSFTGPHLTATATAPDGNTSEFSAPTPGTYKSLTLQQGNTLPKTLLQPKRSAELADNRIGGDYGSDMAGFHEAVFKLGLKWVRLAFDGKGSSLNWQRVEMAPGTYVVSSDEDAFITEMADNGVNIILNLGVGPGDGIEGKRFATEEEIERYLDYVRFMVHHFKGRVTYFELWNEPGGVNPADNTPSNIGMSVDTYAGIIKRAVPIIRQEDPEAKIVVGALGGDWISNFPGYGEFSRSILHIPYLKNLIGSGVMPLVDGISWHPFYGNLPVDPYYQSYPDFVKEIKEMAASEGFEGTYFAEEIKYYSEVTSEAWGKSPPVVTETVAAKYYVRAIVMHLGLGFIVSTAGQLEYNELTPDTIRALCTIMAGAQPIDLPVEIQSEATNIRSYSFSLSNGDRLVALWTDGVAADDDPGIEAAVTLADFSAKKVTAIDVLHGFEQELVTSVEDGSLVIHNLMVKDYPVIIRLSD